MIPLQPSLPQLIPFWWLNKGEPWWGLKRQLRLCRKWRNWGRIMGHWSEDISITLVLAQPSLLSFGVSLEEEFTWKLGYRLAEFESEPAARNSININFEESLCHHNCLIHWILPWRTKDSSTEFIHTFWEGNYADWMKNWRLQKKYGLQEMANPIELARLCCN